MLHIIQNDPEVPPGNISEILEELGVIYIVHHPYCGDPLPELQDISSLIVLGGAMGVYDDLRHPFLRDLKIFVRQVVTAGIPYLGICLGGQLLAAVMGTQVASNRWEELGTLSIKLTQEGSRDAVFSVLPEEFRTFQWHHDSFDIPEGAVLLASSPACPHQAFRVGNVAWGTQFHPEVTAPIIRGWCGWDPLFDERTEGFIAEFCSREEEYRRISRELLRGFLEVTGCSA